MASWEKVCLPKVFGGLGFRNDQRWNHAILAKYIWAISEKMDLLWVKWINSIYLKGSDFWTYKLPPDTSWYWRKLCNLRDKFSREDVKAAGLTGKFYSSILYNNSLCHQQVGYHKAVWSRLSLLKHRFLLWQVVNAQLLTFDNLLRFRVPLDSLLCPVCGDFEESHAHLFFECALSKQVLDLIFGWLDCITWPYEYRFLLWQVVNAQLLTFDNLLRFRVPLDSLLCPVCGDFEESHAHLFFECALSKQVLDLIFGWLDCITWPYEYD
ncbi:uncharacterized protein LOC133832862 [Humulus lupulus]|uniref:uncharacterized protein LOC133832862 n=1 Tax=Humulus lupulus TaxID=3486 RepID=UPI002B40D28F|nr:uncharacterized protein LOC133832862 [Humulus lupulus]